MTRSPPSNRDPWISNPSIAASTIPHFVDRQWQARSPRFLPAETYGAALSAVVIACVDVVLCRQQSSGVPALPPERAPELPPEWASEPMPAQAPGLAEVLLAHRRREPRRGWWIVGGRMQPGESPIAAAQRKVQEEAGLGIAGNRLQFVQTYSTVFGRRTQPPTQEGLHSINLTYAVMLDPREVAAIALDPDEYDRWEWVARSQVGDRLQASEPLDGALAQIMTDLGTVWARLQVQPPDSLPHPRPT